MKLSVGDVKRYVREHLVWYGRSAFRFSPDSGEILFLDPYRVPASAGKADMILITHPHGDHYDRRSVGRIHGERTTVVIPESAAIKDYEGITPGQKIRIGAVSVTAVPAYNLHKRFHPQARRWVGYVIEADGLTLYHAGDTDVIPEMDGLKPDIALLPVGGLFTMNWKKAAVAVARTGAAVAIPMHLVFGGKRSANKFAEAVGRNAVVLPRATA